jgi:hypothetical protein
VSGSDGVTHVFMCKVRRLPPASPHAARPKIFLTVRLPPVPPRLVGTLSALSWLAIRVKDMPPAPSLSWPSDHRAVPVANIDQRQSPSKRQPATRV